MSDQPTTSAPTGPASAGYTTDATASERSATGTAPAGSAGKDPGGAQPTTDARAKGPGTNTPQEVRDGIDRLEFGCEKSLLYHQRRRAWFDGLQKCAVAIATIAGASAVVALLSEKKEIAILVSATSAILSALSLVFGWSDRARLHNELYWQFSDLLAEIQRTASPRAEDLQLWRGKRLTIERQEPPPLDALNVISHNAIAESWGLGRGHRYPIGALQAVFAQLFTFPWARFDETLADRDAKAAQKPRR